MSPPFSKNPNKPPTRLRERKKSLNRTTSIKISKELEDWLRAAAYREGHTMASFIRIAIRDKADRVLGYNRDAARFARNQKPEPTNLD